jgi:hypothetical protein
MSKTDKRRLPSIEHIPANQHLTDLAGLMLASYTKPFNVLKKLYNN